jgi:hypothetical protein
MSSSENQSSGKEKKMRSLREHISYYIQNWEFKRLKNALTIFVMALSLYGILCTVYSDVIVQNDNDCILLPYKSLYEKQIETTFTTLMNQKDNDIPKSQKNIYIFVLDISDSVRNRALPESMKKRYDQGVQFVNNSINNFQINGNHSSTTIMDFAQVRLYELLIELRNNRSKSDDEYAIWTLGDHAIRRFPVRARSIKIPDTIEDAIKNIDSLTIEINKNTDFKELFFRMSNEYKDELEEKQKNEYDNPFFMITILSDLLHDVDNKVKRQDEINQNWMELEKIIQQISYSKIMANMIIFSDNGPNWQQTIFPIFNKNIDWYRLNKYLINDDSNREFLYTVRNTKDEITFFYTNSYFINETSFVIQSIYDKPNRIRIDIPSEINLVPIPKMSILCEATGQNGNELGGGRSKRLVTGGGHFEVELDPQEKIKLVYNGRLPSDLSSPILRISVGNECRTVLVPIIFIKRLPGWAAIIFILLQWITIVAFLGLLWGLFGAVKTFFELRSEITQRIYEYNLRNSILN